jgi:hypothetical protein
MVLAHETTQSADDTPHPYWYARVIGIYHAEVRLNRPQAQNQKTQDLYFLWVRWFGQDPDYRGGWKRGRLERVGFVPDILTNSSDSTQGSGAFGFINPADVIRGVHLIPGFLHGKTSDLLGPSLVRPDKDENQDWRYYYVNM